MKTHARSFLASTSIVFALCATACSSSDTDANAPPGSGGDSDAGSDATQVEAGDDGAPPVDAASPDAAAPSDASWPGYDASTSEVCGNGFDDDQNGQVDEGCPCIEGDTQPCHGGNPLQAGVGACTLGNQVCETTGSGEFETTAWGECNGFVEPGTEVCNGLDDDCDGTVDDEASCPSGLKCAGGQCVEDCSPVDGGWTAWDCSTCSPCEANAFRVCTRQCSNPAPSCGGAACQGESSTQESCAAASTVITLGQGMQSLTACGVYTATVPAGTSQLTLSLWGAGGGGGAPGTGGGGAYVRGTLAVSTGDLVSLHVGCGGMVANGGGGGTYVYVNGILVMVAAGGGAGGSDGCSGCSKNENPAYGSGGAGGPVGGAGQDGVSNDHHSIFAGGGKGATAVAGGVGGVVNDQSAYSTCATNGFAGAKDLGGANHSSQCGAGKSASGHFGGCSGCGNGCGGGGGSGFFGGGSGAAKWTYVGGGGGGGASWIDPSRVSSVTNEGGNYQVPGGTSAAGYTGQAGRGGRGTTDSFDSSQKATAGADGLIVIQ